MSEGIRLGGCRRTPLGSYLKALGVLRLVTEQRDPEARGWWDGQSFRLSSELDEAGLVEFFLKEYAPTPIVAPWNGGSGFHAGDNKEALSKIGNGTDVRFQRYRDALSVIGDSIQFADDNVSLAEVLGKLGPEPRKKEQDQLRAAIPEVVRATLSMRSLCDDRRYKRAASNVFSAYRKVCRDDAGWKLGAILNCRNRLGQEATEWMDCVAVLTSNSEIAYPPILGSGGNEGRQDYTINFMQRLCEVLVEEQTTDNGLLLRNALLGDAVTGLGTGKPGQFDPGRAGGSNQGEGMETKKYPTNQWNYILMMEGVVVWASGISKRSQAGASARTSSPFTVLSKAVGYGSRAKGDEPEARGEIWTPIWERPSRLEEVRSVIREGRAELSGRPARDGLDFAGAAASLGVDRGLAGFERNSILKRRGDSYVCLPVGFLKIRDSKRAGLAEKLRKLLEPVQRMKNKPTMIESLIRVVEEGIFLYLQQEGSREAVAILRALGRLEQRLRLKPKGMMTPLWKLDAEWIQASDDDSAEYRIAAALASIEPVGRVGGMRANLCPVKPSMPGLWDKNKGQECWQGQNLAVRMSAVLRRRMMDVSRLGEKGSALAATSRATVGDVAAFLDGRTDDAKIEDLLFAFSLVDWRDAAGAKRGDQGPAIVWREYALLKLLFCDVGVRDSDGKPLRQEESIVPLLAAQRIPEACEVAKRRLQAGGLSPFRVRYGDSGDGQRLAGALLIPVTGVQGLRRLVLRMEEKESQ